MAIGKFSWFELNTTDPDAAKAFYGAVVGWTTQAWDMGPGYTMWVAASGPVGGVQTLPAEAKAMGAPPHWMGTVAVADAADLVARAEAAGGRVLMPMVDMPDGSRFSVLADPFGASFGVHQSGTPLDPATPDERRGLGEFSWSELMSADPEAALAFYASLFGWVKTSAMDMGEMGTYQMFGLTADRSLGGIMRLPPGMPMSSWLHYANVADAEVAVAKVKELGGSVAHGPADVPGGGHIATCIDPQGVWFAIYAHT